MRELSVDHLHGVKYLKKTDVDLIFDTALNFKEVINRPIKKVPTLRDITIANLFFENSTRTKISFELAQKRLGADVINFSSSSSSVNKGESLIDTVNNILAMKVDMIVLRHPNPGSSILLSKHTESCIINAGDGTHEHPTQALLDSFSLFEKFGSLKGKNILIVGDILHSRVALSNLYLLNLLGANIKISCPFSLVPKDIEKLNASVEPDIYKALRWCDAVNVLRVQRERMIKSYFPNNREYSMLFGLDVKKISSIKKDILILHPGPINRGVEITSDIVESNNSIILEQVENGVAIRMAIMYLLASKLNFSINE
ncbi:MAG: aspartate carbamoyltransferase catalytic subunit [Bacteroidetes bacterium]|jgi:aspartate carbamoyltransferase catalytic subunit|nr:aspartate carbamoyltransferase catalytic subunit [Cryomorphaceae bacterium]MDA0330359.1 aspartate carbamoyltransferase catalytic subunit [Bacteroidota bacterium]MDA0884911.1 aspartate carbamoyltransferase catalytic subunit [Bacteroidota bacterium]MDA1225963.1 aspartate carbamoyltransferase catalytic subunit [Bacteroidota bacterium]